MLYYFCCSELLVAGASLNTAVQNISPQLFSTWTRCQVSTKGCTDGLSWLLLLCYSAAREVTHSRETRCSPVLEPHGSNSSASGECPDKQLQVKAVAVIPCTTTWCRGGVCASSSSCSIYSFSCLYVFWTRCGLSTVTELVLNPWWWDEVSALWFPPGDRQILLVVSGLTTTPSVTRARLYDRIPAWLREWFWVSCFLHLFPCPWYNSGTFECPIWFVTQDSWRDFTVRCYCCIWVDCRGSCEHREELHMSTRFPGCEFLLLCLGETRKGRTLVLVLKICASLD